MANRWSPAMDGAPYGYDPVGNLTNINHPTSSNLTFHSVSVTLEIILQGAVHVHRSDKCQTYYVPTLTMRPQRTGAVRLLQASGVTSGICRVAINHQLSTINFLPPDA